MLGQPRNDDLRLVLLLDGIQAIAASGKPVQAVQLSQWVMSQVEQGVGYATGLAQWLAVSAETSITPAPHDALLYALQLREAQLQSEAQAAAKRVGSVPAALTEYKQAVQALAQIQTCLQDVVVGLV